MDNVSNAEWEQANKVSQKEWDEASPSNRSGLVKKMSDSILDSPSTDPFSYFGKLALKAAPNIPGNAVDVIKGLYNAPAGIHDLARGGAQKVDRLIGAQNLSPEPTREEQVFDSAVEAVVDPIRKSIDDPLGVPQRIEDYIVNKPIDAGLIATGGMGAVGKLGNMGRLSAAAEAVNPLAVAGKASVAPINKLAASSEPAHFYGTAAKIRTTLPPETKADILKTWIDNGITLNETGYNNLVKKTGDLENKLDEVLKPHYQKEVDASKVVSRVDETFNAINEGKFHSKQNIADAQKVVDEFLDNHEMNITVKKAQSIKRDIYQQLKEHYAKKERGVEKYTNAEVAAQKNIARGLKEEIEAVANDSRVKDVNAAMGSLWNTEPYLRRAVGRTSNHNIFSIDDALAGGIGHALAGNPGALALFLLKHVVGDPAMKSRIAINMAKKRTAPERLGNVSLNAYYQGGRLTDKDYLLEKLKDQ